MGLFLSTPSAADNKVFKSPTNMVIYAGKCKKNLDRYMERIKQNHVVLCETKDIESMIIKRKKNPLSDEEIIVVVFYEMNDENYKHLSMHIDDYNIVIINIIDGGNDTIKNKKMVRQIAIMKQHNWKATKQMCDKIYEEYHLKKQFVSIQNFYRVVKTNVTQGKIAFCNIKEDSFSGWVSV